MSLISHNTSAIIRRIAAALLAGAAITAGVLTAAPAIAAPTPPLRPGAVQVFGPFHRHQTCVATLSQVKGAYAIPPLRRANRWHEGGTFSSCYRVRSGWQFTLTAPKINPRNQHHHPRHREFDHQRR